MVVAVPAVAAAVVKTKVASAAAAKAMRATTVAVKCILKKANGWINPRPTNLIEKTYFVGVEVLGVILRKLEN